jgi:hypothetical protein
VAANIALRSVPDTAPNGDSLRAAALRRYHVTERDLLRFVRVHGRNAEYMSKVWGEISDTLQHRYEREIRGGRPANGPLPPGMAAPDADARPDSTVGKPPVIVRPSGEPVPVPPPTRGVQPTTIRPPKHVAPSSVTPPARTPPPPTDRRPMTPPPTGLKPPPKF